MRCDKVISPKTFFCCGGWSVLVFVAAHRLSLAAASRGSSLGVVRGSSLGVVRGRLSRCGEGAPL